MTFLTRHFLLVFAALMVGSGCSHYGPYSPVTVGQGLPSSQEIESCTDYILLFPRNAHNLRLDTVLRENNLQYQDVYTVELRSWLYLFPIYANRCLIVTLNKDAVERGVRGEPIDIGEKAEDAKDPICIRFRDNKICSLKDCELVHPLNKKNCEAAYSRVNK